MPMRMAAFTRALPSPRPQRDGKNSPECPRGRAISFCPSSVTWVAGGSPFPTPSTNIAGRGCGVGERSEEGRRLTAHLARQNAKQAGKCPGVQKATLCFVNQMDSQIG